MIDEPLSKRLQARRETTERQSLRLSGGKLCGTAQGNPPSSAGRRTKMRCRICSPVLQRVEFAAAAWWSRLVARNARKPEYICHRRRVNGSCTNTLRVLVSEMHEAMLHAIEEHALTPEAIEQVIQLTEHDDAAEQQAALIRERKELDKRIARLVVAVETAGDITSLVDKLRELEARRKEVERDLISLRPLPRLPQQVIDNQLGHWRPLLRGSPLHGRAVMQRILRGRIVFTPRADGDGYDIIAPTRFDKLFTGIVVRRPDFIPFSKDGAEHIVWRTRSTSITGG